MLKHNILSRGQALCNRNTCIFHWLSVRIAISFNTNIYGVPTYDLIFFFNSHPVQIFPPRFKYSHPGLNILTRFKYFHPGLNISTPGLNIYISVEIFEPG